LATDKPAVSAGFLTCYPDYARSFREIVRVLLSHSGVYEPEQVELGRADNYITVPFDRGKVEELVTKWEVQSVDRPGWIFQRNNPIQVSMLITKPVDFLSFSHVSLNIERGYFETPEIINEFLTVLKELYAILHPAYGDVSLQEMIRSYDHSLGKVKIGTDINRALPDIYWANFLGPEYVDMFGNQKVFSAPCHSVERLSDGGALLLVSPSPKDYLEDLNGFEKDRERLKNYLGLEAFDTGEINYRGKVPKFRYLEDRQRNPSAPRTKSSGSRPDMLSQVRREEWENWIRESSSLANEFVQEMGQRGVVLDFSEESLNRLDECVHELSESNMMPSIEFLKKSAAYVAQLVIRNTGAKWTFQESKDVPSLWIGTVQISPLARAQKVIIEHETFEHWYRFITKELITGTKQDTSPVEGTVTR